MSTDPSYQRILLKLSGEALIGKRGSGIDGDFCKKIASQIAQIHKKSVQIALVIGGGNFFRGADAHLDIPRIPADQIGMLATLMNGIAFQQILLSLSVPTRVMSAVPCPFVEAYHPQDAIKALVAGTVLIFVGGLGHPYFTTDSAAALRAIEIQADILLKATQVDGIYDGDPKKTPNAVKFDRVPYSQVLAKKLQVMDLTAISLCQENRMPIRVFDLHAENSLLKAVQRESIGTLVEGV